jgi:hypothetical protein
VAQVIERLPSKHKALNLIPSTERERERGNVVPHVGSRAWICSQSTHHGLSLSTIKTHVESDCTQCCARHWGDKGRTPACRELSIRHQFLCHHQESLETDEVSFYRKAGNRSEFQMKHWLWCPWPGAGALDLAMCPPENNTIVLQLLLSTAGPFTLRNYWVLQITFAYLPIFTRNLNWAFKKY